MKNLITSLVLLSCLFLTPPCQAQLPSGTVLWLRADQGINLTNGLVTEWATNDGTGTKAVGLTPSNQPSLAASAINGHPAIRFSGAQLMTCSPVYPVAKDYTLFYVVKLSNLSATNNIVSGNTHATYTNPTRLLHGNFNTLATAPIALTTAPALITVQFRQGSQNGKISVNGQPGDSAFVGTNSDSTIFLGAYASSNFMVGDIAEVALYNRSLSAADVRKAEDYMLQRYGIARYVAPPVDTTFSSIPQSKHFYARDENDGADILVRGYVVAPNQDSVSLFLFRDNLLIEKQSQSLNYTNGSAPFQFNSRIKSELREYRIEVASVSDEILSTMAVRDSIVCGDVYLIAGQSNTVFGGVSNNLEFVRTYGGTASSNKADTLFSTANATGGGSNIGGFGMRLAELIMQNHAVPVCIINGGVGGTTIEQNSRVDNQPELTTSIYGSMLYRIRKARFTDKAKALFWYQGESNQVTNYAQNFRRLHSDWLKDYPSLEKVYMVQIRPGCASFATHDLLRDVQRAMQDSLPKLETMSAVALPGHDGCHYTAVGYTALGTNLFRLVERDFYGSDDVFGISAPAISRAFFTDNSRNRIALIFREKTSGMRIQPSVTVGGNEQQLRDHIYFDVGPKVTSISTSSDTVFLDLSGASNATSISYTPAVFYNNTSVIYQGPWITNARGIGALTFAKFPITPKPVVGVNEDQESDQQIFRRVSPQPASDHAKIQLDESDGVVNSIRCIDNLGSEFKVDITNPDSSSFSVATSGLPTGSYRLLVNTTNSSFATTLLVVR